MNLIQPITAVSLGLVLSLIATREMAHAASQELMISINKDNVKSAMQMAQALPILTRAESIDKNCLARTVVNSFIPYDQDPGAPYYVVAIAHLDSNCKQAEEKLLRAIESDGRFTLYSNTPVEPLPGISIGN